MRSLHYLTVQDILWINLQVTKKVQHFNFAKLEEATFCQYAYGESKSLVPQAGRFLSSFLKLRPFDAGNTATAFVGCLTFLRINGLVLKLDDGKGSSIIEQVNAKHKAAADLLEELVTADLDAHHGPVPDIRGTIKQVLCDYIETVAALAKHETVSVA